MSEDEDRRLERLLNAAQDWCSSYLEIQRSPEEVPRALGVHQYHQAALKDALDAYPRKDNDDKEDNDRGSGDMG